MQFAINAAREAYTDNEVPVAALISLDDKIIACRANKMEQNLDPIAHAEITVIKAACKILKTNKLNNCSIYVTLEPCPMCAYAISLARIHRLYFGAFDEKSGGVENGPKIFNSSSCHHKPLVFGGILEEECKQLLKDFFKSKRL